VARIAGADPPQPYLSVWNPSQKPIRGSQFVPVNLVCSGFDIDRNESALVSLFQNGAKLTFVNRVPSASEFFFGVTRLAFHCDTRFFASGT
jgi:hypothetical protein